MSYYQSYNSSSNAQVAPSENQIKTYYQQCERKRITPQDVSKMSRAEMTAELQRIFDLPLPAHENQLATLKATLQELVDAGVPGVRMPSDKFFFGLNRESASKWIDDVRALRSANIGLLPPNDEQLDKLVRMMMFPEIEWESIVSEVKETHEYYECESDGDKLHYHKESIQYTSNTCVNRKIMMNEYIGDKQLWRFMTKEEFRSELKQKLSHTQASRIISEFQGLHEAWARTRLSREQYRQIRRLEERMANIHTSRPMGEPVATLEGGESDVPFALASRKEDYSPRAYEPLAEELIVLFDMDEADVYINQLMYELKDSELRATTNAQDLPYTSEGLEEIRVAKDDADKRTNEFKALNDFMYGLSDIVGFGFEVLDNGMPITVESMRHDALQVFFNGSAQEQKNDLFMQIVSFVKLAIEDENITFNGLLRLANNSEIASEVLDHIISDAKYAKLILDLQRAQFARR